MGEVTHTDKGNGVQMSFYTSLYHTYYTRKKSLWFAILMSIRCLMFLIKMFSEQRII